MWWRPLACVWPGLAPLITHWTRPPRAAADWEPSGFRNTSTPAAVLTDPGQPKPPLAAGVTTVHGVGKFIQTSPCFFASPNRQSTELSADLLRAPIIPNSSESSSHLASLQPGNAFRGNIRPPALPPSVRPPGSSRSIRHPPPPRPLWRRRPRLTWPTCVRHDFTAILSRLENSALARPLLLAPATLEPTRPSCPQVCSRCMAANKTNVGPRPCS